MIVGRITQLTTQDSATLLGAALDSSVLTAVAIPVDDLKAVTDWMREPDHVENVSLEWLTDWINRRPLAILYRAAPTKLTYAQK